MKDELFLIHVPVEVGRVFFAFDNRFSNFRGAVLPRAFSFAKEAGVKSKRK